MNKKIIGIQVIDKMHYKNLVIVGALALTLVACSSPTTKNSSASDVQPPKSVMVKAKRSQYPEGMTDLHWTALEESNDAVLEQLIGQASEDELNQANALGHTPTHYIFATRPWEVALLAWERGGKPALKTSEQESGWAWRAEFLDDPVWLAVERALQDSSIRLATSSSIKSAISENIKEREFCIT